MCFLKFARIAAIVACWSVASGGCSGQAGRNHCGPIGNQSFCVALRSNGGSQLTMTRARAPPDARNKWAPRPGFRGRIKRLTSHPETQPTRQPDWPSSLSKCRYHSRAASRSGPPSEQALRLHLEKPRSIRRVGPCPFRRQPKEQAVWPRPRPYRTKAGPAPPDHSNCRFAACSISTLDHLRRRSSQPHDRWEQSDKLPRKSLHPA